MLTMTEKKPKKPGKSNLSVQMAVRLKPEWAAALDAYCASLRPSPEKTEVLRVALEDFLIAKGFQPKDADNPE